MQHESPKMCHVKLGIWGEIRRAIKHSFFMLYKDRCLSKNLECLSTVLESIGIIREAMKNRKTYSSSKAKIKNKQTNKQTNKRVSKQYSTIFDDIFRDPLDTR